MMGKAETQIRNENTQELFVRILFIVLWAQSTIMPYVAQIFRRLPIIGNFYGRFVGAIILMLFILSFRKIIKKMTLFDMLFFLTMAIVVLVSLAFYPRNAEYIEPEIGNILFSVLPMYLFGVCYDHELVKKDLYIVSIGGLIIKALTLGASVKAEEIGYGYDMQAAYVALPNAMYVLYWAFEKKKLLTWIPPILSFALLCAYGTRGPLLAYALYFGFLVFFSVSSKKKATRVLIIVVVALLLIVFVASNMFMEIIEKAAELFNDIGLSTRIFDKILEGELTDDSGRAYLTAKVTEAISENWIFGLGYMGDRTVLDGVYTHNIFLEIICTFGVPLGCLLLFILVTVSILALVKTYSKPEFYFVALMVMFVFIRLMFSGSYATERYFYFMLGICASVIRKYKGEGKKTGGYKNESL